MADKQGFLTKEGGSIKTWKKRWMVLKDGKIYYSKNPAESADEMKSWMDILNKTLGKMKQQQAAGGDGQKAKDKKVGVEDFDLLNVIGKGSFGKVMQVRKKDTGMIYAMKVLNKKNIIERNEMDHTRAERNILRKLVHPFLINLIYSFQTEDKLYFIMDFVNGGELFYHLQNEEKFDETRVRFYCAEIVCGLEYLHACGVIYRDLKPENILLTSDGHACLTDFGISKEGLLSTDDRTATFCGTPEYLAPEILKGEKYGKAVDWWSFGTLMYEMLSGLPPFYSQDVRTMYSNIMNQKLGKRNKREISYIWLTSTNNNNTLFVLFTPQFSPEARDFISLLLERDPAKRLKEAKVAKAHPFFKGIDWDKCVRKELVPPFIPHVKGKNDTGQIDAGFLAETAKLSVDNTRLSSSMQKNFENFTFVADSDFLQNNDAHKR
ncbi:hypothetical protein DFA_05853 [Cavenderia fasciculata]|uniref:non-specific serine/threonine protein kinase n=1 Tax=Cavenderia fasciculata TaxID=261658 RepID=F4PN29_CACFS|nr:uncharacterized protein DFA_05853 [Cavenderia fasciculata]EGG23719.1 hypothetical protein DFA_05853 [Cavenderia fasciculata]|eukprot:XP_004361570.1 hypothetical protein DFA_05853 [Cavenderia fasciculata]